MSPKSKKQFKAIRERSAATIKQAALELFARRGYHNTSISQIAREAGVSKGLLYNYFSGKEALLEAIVMGAVKEGEQLFAKNLKPGDPPGLQLRHLIEGSFAMIKGNLQFWKLITSLAFQEDVLDHFSDLIKEKGEATFQQISKLFEQMEVENPDEEARMLGAVMDGIAIHYMNLGDQYPFEKMKKYTIEKFCTSKI